MANQYTNRPISVEQRFWTKVLPANDSECWIWQGALNVLGYGSITVRAKEIRAHRFSYALCRGAIPDGLLVLHNCDNPPCVNPAHLRLGTVKDNQADMDARHRRPHGEDHWARRRPELVRRGRECPLAKVNPDSVRIIRARRARGETLKAIGLDFDLSIATVSKIAKMQAWKHVI